MKIKEYTLGDMYTTLDDSISSEEELMDLLVYNPHSKKRLVEGRVPHNLLKDRGLIDCSSKKCKIATSLWENIKRFNDGDSNEFYVGDSKIIEKRLWYDPTGLKIVPYHVHPLEDQEIFPSKEDMNEIRRWSAPFVVVGSKKARDEYRMKPPFVTGHVSEDRSYSERNLDKMLQYETDLARGEHTSRCFLSVNFEIVK